MHPTLLCRVAALAALAWVVLPAAPALAHAIIVEASPSVGAVVHTGAVDVRMRFNSRIDRRRSRLLLLDAAGQETALKLDEKTPADVITARIPILTAGDHRLRWQVLALDGHITRGDIPFSVTAP
jgi:copper resistance protein C